MLQGIVNITKHRENWSQKVLGVSNGCDTSAKGLL